MSRFAVAAAILILNSTYLSAGFNLETGTAVFQHYSSKQYGASPQNWSVTQDRRGVVYVANTDGVLEFDGTTWRLIRLPNGTVTRSVNVDAAGTVYVGGIGDFGILKPDSHGAMQFVSLKAKVPTKDRSFADIWKIVPTRKGVYFSATSRLFRLNDDGSVKVWRPEKKFGRAFYVLDGLFVQTAGTGLMRMSSEDKLYPVDGGARFATDVVYAAASNGRVTVIATASHLYRLEEQGVTLFASTGDEWMAANVLNSLLVLPDGEMVLGSRKGGAAVMSPNGTIDRVLSTASGLADDFVSDIHADAQGGVWMALNNGLTRFNPALSRLDQAELLAGDVQTVARHQNSLYAGSTAGLFQLSAAPGTRPRFAPVAGLTSTAWALLPRKADLLASTDLSLFSVTGSEAKTALYIGRPIYDLSVSLRDNDLIYAAGRKGITVIRENNGRWKKEDEFEAPGEEFRSVLEDADGLVWGATKGSIWRLDFSKQPVASEKFGSQQGVPDGWINGRRLNGHIVFTTATGIKRFDESRKRFVADDELGTQFSDGSRDVFNIFEETGGNVWVTGEKYHGILLKQATGYKWYPMPLLEAGIGEIYWMWNDPDGTAWATGADFVLHRWERATAGDPDKDFRVLTRRVQELNSQKNWYGGAGKVPGGRLPWSQNALRFEFAAPFFEEPSSVEYQVKLDGSDNDWTPWSHETKRDYTHLPEGTYKFHVRARTPHGTVAEDSSVAFGVLPPWYRTWWAYSGYVVLGGFGIWGIVGWRTKQLMEDKRKLEGIVEERTAEVVKQRDEIQVEQEKSQSLLLNILPAKVADELKTTGAVQPMAFDDVTVCFTDFVGFTVSSEKMAPGSLVNALNEYFTRFDEIVARYGLEKLKTIGDSYMFASGLPAARASHAVDAVLAALEMVEVVRELGARADGTGWDIRVGLHSGPVVAGVVGTRKFAFDIWGNTVNFAARMESSGVPGKVNVSERTCLLTRGLIDCESRGHVKIKEGRELPMFLAHGPAGDAREFGEKYREEFGVELRGFPVGSEIRQALAAGD